MNETRTNEPGRGKRRDRALISFPVVEVLRVPVGRRREREKGKEADGQKKKEKLNDEITDEKIIDETREKDSTGENEERQLTRDAQKNE